MSAERAFLEHLDSLGVVISTARPATNGSEFTRSTGWQALSHDGNAARIKAWQPGHALLGVMGGRVAVFDVDTKNGADPAKVVALLDGIGVRIYANVLTPSGGRHFYVAGHPDLPTVHARAGRDGLTGYPGLEVISYAANVFLPGTARAKYGGAGYVILSDDLERLADGGDDDSAQALTSWVSEHRVSRGQAFTPSPPWDGAPPDKRQAAYLEAVLTRQADELAAMRPESGRNHALYLAGLKCGNYVAGAGMDEAQVVDRLTAAATRCGLLAEDGPRSVGASLRSGLGNGRKNPRAVPPAKGDDLSWVGGRVDLETGEVLEPDEPPWATVPPITLALAHDVFTRWLGVDYDLDSLDVMLIAAAVEQLDGDPLWLLLISGSGNAKTETVQALDGIGATVTSTISSQGALLSATSKKERTEDATGGLLRKIGDRGVLVIKDMTSVLSMNRDMRAEVLGAVREVYDGRWSRNVGTDGGRTLEWTGRIALIGAVTTAWDRAHDVIASMGDRFVLLRMDSTTGRQAAGRQAIGNTGYEVRMRAELAQAVAGVMAGMASASVTVTAQETAALLAAADLVTLARTGVEYDYRGDVIDAHAPEMPTRFAKQLAQVIRGGAALGIDRGEALRLAIRCARDSMPPLRLAILDDLAGNPGSSTADVRKRLGKPRNTVDRQLQALHMLGVLTCEEEEVEWAGKAATRWHYRIADGIEPDALRPQISPRNVSTYPQTPEEERPAGLPSVRLPTDISGTDPLCPCGARLSEMRSSYGKTRCVDCERRASA